MTDLSPQNVSVPMLSPITQLFSDSWHLYKERFWILIGILIVPLIFIGIGEIAVSYGFPGSVEGGIFILIGWLISIVATIAIIFAIAKGMGVAESYRGAITIFWPALWMGILIYFAVLGGIIMLIIPGIIMGIWFAFSSYVLVVENKRELSVLCESREYIRGYWWQIFGRNILLAITTGAIFLVIYLPTLFIFGKTAGMIVYCVLELLILPFTFVYFYKIYENLAAIKPALATAPSTSSRKLFITSAIIGFVAPIIIFIAFFFLILPILTKGNLAAKLGQAPGFAEQTIIGQGKTVSFESFPGTLSEVSIELPVGFEAVLGDQNTVFIQQTTSTPLAALSYIGISRTPSSLSSDAYLRIVRSLVAQYNAAQFHYRETTTTFVGYPANTISYQVGNKQTQLIIFQAEGSVFGVAIDEISSSMISGSINEIAASIKIATPASK